MIVQHIERILRQNFPFEATAGQESLINELAVFIAKPCPNEIMLIKGFAGTGKTSLISSFIHALGELKMKTVLLAPTGRAAKVLSQWAEQPSFTIHKKIFRQRSSPDGLGEFMLDRNLHTDTIFIVDEASMIGNEYQEQSMFGSGDLLTDLLNYVYNQKNCRMILIGDTAQLPPVGIDLSPALSSDYFSQKGFRVREWILHEVVRHSADSGILFNATTLRSQIDSLSQSWPTFKMQPFEDVKRLSGQEVLEKITDAYQNSGLDETMIICRSNKQANRYNQGIRRYIYGYDEEIAAGDYLMVVKNNYFWLQNEKNTEFIANGDILRIKRIRKYEELFGFRFADITVVFPDLNEQELDVKIMLDTLLIDSPSLPADKSREFYLKVSEDYAHELNKRKRWELIKKDPYFNALQVKFSYAVTCHKAQGGQWKTVFIDPGYQDENPPDREYCRWLYTAFTRASEKVYLVNFSDKYFPGS